MFSSNIAKNKREVARKPILMQTRIFILSNIADASEWASADNTSNYAVIKENLQFLKNILRLNTLNVELMYLEADSKNNNELSGILTNRQMNCMLNISFNVQAKNVQGAFHELYDFIESYQMLEDKPIDTVEKIIIRISIIQIESILR